jgi:pyruvate/2-oxoglutarate dehydrogenase complex dihydrolipoamide dehydrogenase (E3) component
MNLLKTIQLFHRDDVRLPGVHVMSEQATEVVHIGVVAMMMNATAELFNRAGFRAPQTPRKKWGPCLSERRWGAVRDLLFSL